jgi:hypothetical protein
MQSNTGTYDAALGFGTTITEALKTLSQRGYKSSFRVAGPQHLQCLSCRSTNPAIDHTIEAMSRIEGVSDPDDEDLIIALICPRCDKKGTLLINYGTNAGPEEASVLEQLHRRTMSSTKP